MGEIGTDYIPTYDDFTGGASREPEFSPENGGPIAQNPTMAPVAPHQTGDFIPGNANDGSWMMHQIEQALQQSEDPDNDRARIYAASWLQDKLGGYISIEEILGNPDMYMEHYAGRSVMPQDFWKMVENDFVRGSLSVAIGHIGLGMLVNGDEESFKKIRNLLEKMPRVADSERGFLNSILGGTAQLLPPMGASLLATWAGAKSGGALAGPKGAIVGGAITGFTEAFTLATGNIYADILMMDDPETGRPMWEVLKEQTLAGGGDAEEAFHTFNRLAALYATGGGVLSGIIEVIQLDTITGGKILDKVVGKHLVDIAEKAWTSQYLKNSFSRFVVNYGLNMTEEIVQEMAQESFEWWSNELAQRDIARDLELAGYSQQDTDAFMVHLKEVMETTASAMVLMGLPGSIVKTGQQQIYDAREERGAGRITWEQLGDMSFVELAELNFQRPSDKEVAAAEGEMNNREKEPPLRTEELDTGEIVIVPEDRARAAVLEDRKITTVPVLIAGYKANIDPDMDAQTVAASNNMRFEGNQILAENTATIERMAAQNPNQFKLTETGYQYVNLETNQVTPIKSEVGVAIEDSGLNKIVQELEEKVEEMPEDIKVKFEDMKASLAQMERTGNIGDLAVALDQDERFGIPLDWFGNQDAKKFSEIQDISSKLDDLSEKAVPIREDLISDKIEEVYPFEADKRAEFYDLKDQRLRMGPQTDPMLIEQTDAKLKELAPYAETTIEAQVREATERGTRVTDDVLARYKDRPWAAEEIAHRRLLKQFEGVYNMAFEYWNDIDGFARAVETPGFWGGTEEALATRDAFFEMVPDDEQGKYHFYEDMVERVYYKTERNIEEFIEAVSTDEGLSAWLKKIAHVRYDLPTNLRMVLDRISRGLEPTTRQMSRIRGDLIRNAGYWQPRFLAAYAEINEDAAYELQAQKDYEYLRQLREPRRDAEGAQVESPLMNSNEAQLDQYINTKENRLKSLQEALRSARSEAALQRREAVRREVQKVKEEIRVAKKLREDRIRLARQIKRPAPKNVALKYKDIIVNLQGLLDPGFRSKANTQAWLDEYEALWNKYKGSEMREIAEKVKMKPRPLNLWTTEELTALRDEIKRLKEKGQDYQARMEALRAVEHRQTRESFIEGLTGGEPPNLPTGGSLESKKMRRGSWRIHERLNTLRPSRVIRMLEGWKEGPLYDYFITKTNSLYDQALELTLNRRETMHTKMEELGLRFTDLAKMTDFNGEHFSRDAMISIYVYNQNDKSARALRQGNGMSENQISNMIDNLTDAERALGDFLIEEFNRHFHRMEKAYEIFMNEHLKKETRYFPMLRKEKSWEKDTEDFWDQFHLRNEYTNTAVDRSATKERVDLYGEQSEIHLGAIHIWTQQVEKHEHWIAMGSHVRDMRRVIGRWQTKKALLPEYGDAAMKWLNKYIDSIANPTYHKGYDGLSIFSRWLRKNTAVAYLAYNAVTVMKQIPSIALFLRDAGPLRLLAAAAKYVSNHNEMKHLVDSYDPQMAARIMTQEIELIRQQEKKGLWRAVGAVGRAGMKPIQWVDSAVTHIGWLAVYDQYKHLGHTEAVRRAQMAVLETQPSARAKDLAQLYRSGEITNWVTMFSNQLNNIWNMASADTIYAWKNKEYNRLTGIVVGIGISTMCMMLLGGWRPGDDEEAGFVLEFTKQLANMVPVVGKSVSSGVDGWNNSVLDIFPVASEFGHLYRDVFEWKDEDLLKGIGDVLMAAGVSAGIPTTAIRRPKKAIEEEDWREMFGPVFK